VSIGPLTNIALATLREPRVAGMVRRIVIMGGMIQRRYDQLAAPYVEHNIRCDPEAAKIVLTSGAPITLVPLDVTTLVRVRHHVLAELVTDPLGSLLADQLDRYMRHQTRDWTHPHDPLAASVILRPDFVGTEPMHVDVETSGELTRGETVATRAADSGDGRPIVDVALTVDTQAFEQWLVPALAGSPAAWLPG
jgi:purine nucleosidase